MGFITAIGLAIAVFGPPQVPALVQDDPKLNWVIKSIESIREAGLSVGTDRFPLYRMTRYELAVYVYAWTDHLETLLNRKDKLSTAEAAENQRELNRWKPFLDDLERLTAATPRELTSLGVSMQGFLNRQRSVIYRIQGLPAVPGLQNVPFPDVPTNHWARGAVEELRRRGILVGYPDGKFRG